MKIKNLSEIKNCIYLIICKKLIALEIEEFFWHKDNTCYGLLPDLLMHRRVNKIIFNKYDLDEIYQISEKVMLEILLKRYKNLPVPIIRLKRTLNIHVTLFNLSQTEQRTIDEKKRLSKDIDLFFKKAIFSILNLLPKIKKKSGKFDTFKEKYLNEEYERIRKTLKLIKKEVIREINNQVTDQFMSIHNKLLQMLQKKTLSKIAEVETQKNQVIEA